MMEFVFGYITGFAVCMLLDLFLSTSPEKANDNMKAWRDFRAMTRGEK
jgi:multisubunit Na+/H+ antiporter MnhE subunit